MRPMEIIFNQNPSPPPLISIILLDWSIRESFHILYYLSRQTIPREQYEVIWIEYYNKRAPEIEAGIEESKKLGIPPIVDKCIVMDMPKNIYYHKHLIYNIGTLVARGKIVTFCDSDAIVKPTFIESIIESFDEDSNIVLQMDEVRNNDKRFYPFNYPSIEEVIGEGCINWRDGKTTGLLDRDDPLHTRNYGACMAALRDDLINICGADEHIDYLGHICGPYEMTFRLVNAGKKEVWHQEEFLYHTWHPGTAGKGNYLGPHDGRHMSTTALKIQVTGRIFPLVENPAINELRHKHEHDQISQLIYQAIPEEKIGKWSFDEVKRLNKPFFCLENIKKNQTVILKIKVYLLYVSVKRFLLEAVNFFKKMRSQKELLKGFINSSTYLKNHYTYHYRILERCLDCIKQLLSQEISEVSIYGGGVEAEILFKLLRSTKIRIKAVYDASGKGKFLEYKIMPINSIKSQDGKIIIIGLLGAKEKVQMLKRMGLKGEDIVIL